MTKHQIEVITSVERRRRWSREEKERLIAATLECLSQHQPLNRQSERYAREGIDLSLSTRSPTRSGPAGP